MRFLLLALVTLSTLSHAGNEKSRNLLLRDLIKNAFDFRTPDKEISPAVFEGKKGNILFFVRGGCPIAKLYTPRYKDLIQKYKEDFNFFIVFSSADETPKELSKSILGNVEGAITVHDSLSLIAKQAEISVSPTVLLLDGQFSYIYKGPIDDQYGISGRKPAPLHNYLEDRVLQIKNGTSPAFETIQTQGCDMGLYEYKTDEKAKSNITYYSHIKSIIQRGQCLRCHQDNNIAEFQPLGSYEDVAGVSLTAATRISSRRMPPWQADPRYGDFHDAKRLSIQDIQTFVEWTKNGSPKGDPKDEPKNTSEDNHASIESPDRVWKMPVAFDVPADGVLEYKYFLTDSGLTEDTWVSAVNVLPGKLSVVHHSRLFVIPPDMQIEEPTLVQKMMGHRLKLSEEQLKWATALWGSTGSDPSPTSLGSYTPGTNRAFSEGMGVLIPKGSKILFEQHYTPNGTAAKDQTSVSVKFSKTPPKYQILELPLGPKLSIKIPPGDANYSITSEYEFPRKAKIVSFRPHMHLRGKSYRVEIVKPGKEKETLLWIPHWDYKWQTYYEFKTPIDVEPGTQILATATWDNSAENPSNPNPADTVTFGPKIDDEMAMAYMNMVWAD